MFDAPPQRSPLDLMARPSSMRLWLQSKDPSEIVAIQMSDPNNCLAATFLKAHGIKRPSVRGYTFGSGEPIPQWFIDASHRIKDWHKPVTAAEALKALG